MSPKRFISPVALFLISFLISSARADLPATRPSDSEFTGILRNLDSENPDTRDQAQAIIMGYPLILPMLMDAAHRTDLSPEAITRINHCIELLGPGYNARLRAEKDLEVVELHRRQDGVQAYQTFGDRDPKWDSAAITAIRLATETVRGTGERSNAGEIARRSQTAIAAGCNDPLVKYFHVRFRSDLIQASQNPAPIIAAARDAAANMLTSQYCARLRTNAVFDAIGAETQYNGDDSILNSELDRKLLDQALALLPDIVKEEAIAWRIGKSVNFLEKDYALVLGDREKAFNLIYPVLSKAMPNSAEPLLFKGSVYINYAWDARGGGLANSVTDQGWKRFANRLAIARQALMDAYAIDPNDSRISAKMITVCMGQSTPQLEMEMWFTRAINANPDDAEACENKLAFLEPKWGGSAEAVLAFGHACLATEYWSSDLPQVLINAHLDLSKESGDPAQYFANPDVWTDVQKVYTGYLAAYPDNTKYRSWYTFLACKCGKFAVAETQFKLLGNHIELAPFKTTRNLQLWRRRAAQAIADTQKST